MTKLTLKSIQTAIGSFTSNRDKLQAQGHSIAMMIFYHSAPKAISDDCNGTGDCSEAVNLLKAMPTSWANQLLGWFKAFTPIRVNVSTGKYGYDPLYHKMETEAEKLAFWKLEEAVSTPFYEYEREVPVRDDSFTVEKLIATISRTLKQAESANENGKIAPDQKGPVNAAVKMLEALDLKSLIPATKAA